MEIERSIDIERPMEAVFAFVSDPRNDAAWCPKVKSVEGGDPSPGASYTVVHRPVPVLSSRRMTYRLLDWRPSEEITWHEDDGHDEITVTYRLRALAPARTRFTQHDEIVLGAARVLHPLMRLGMRHDIDAQLRRLKEHLEGS